MKKQTKKRKKWMRYRHWIVRNIAYAVLYPWIRFGYHAHIRKFKEGKKRPYLVLMNHQTAFDQFFVGISIPRRVYYVASEDLFSLGFLSKLLVWAVNPIPIKKQMTDVSAVMTCARVAKEGGTIAIAPEGNRTYAGKTGYIKPSIVGLIRFLKLPVAFYRIEGGFGVHPRFSDKVRGGRIDAGVSRVLTKEEYDKMTDDELFALLTKELAVDEGVKDIPFPSKRSAEYLERAMYVCPTCGFSTFRSHKDTFRCETCGKTARYLATKEIEGVDTPFPFRFLTEWYAYQEDYINAFDSMREKDTLLYEDTAALYRVELYKGKKLLKKRVTVRLYGGRMEIDDGEGLRTLSFDKVDGVTVLGKNKLNVYFDGTVYQCKGDERFCALKYVNLYHRYRNIAGGDVNGKFLGL